LRTCASTASNRIAINLHFKSEVIRESFCGWGGGEGGADVIRKETELLGTAGGIKKMEGFSCATAARFWCSTATW